MENVNEVVCCLDERQTNQKSIRLCPTAMVDESEPARSTLAAQHGPPTNSRTCVAV